MMEDRRPHVFITDGSYPNALAAIRALGRAGFRVTVGEHQGVPAPAISGFFSRYCARRFRYPDPRMSPEATARALTTHFAESSYDAAIPVGLTMAELFSARRAMLGVHAMLPAPESFTIAANKPLTYAHAERVGIPVPRTVSVERWSQLGAPVVFKHRKSGVLIARTAREAASHAATLNGNAGDYVVQSYVEGQNGFGYFGFFRHGEEIAYFMHERLLQHPHSGGQSVIARAIRDERLRTLGRHLLESLNWHGPAMVEFKRSEADGEFYLMEINPKLWGSLDLAIAAGCDFPVWIANALIYGTYPEHSWYRDGLTYQWLIPHGLTSLKQPEYRRSLLRNVFSREARTDLSWSDPIATAAGLLTMCAKVIHR